MGIAALNPSYPLENKLPPKAVLIAKWRADGNRIWLIPYGISIEPYAISHTL